MGSTTSYELKHIAFVSVALNKRKGKAIISDEFVILTKEAVFLHGGSLGVNGK